MCVFLLRYMTRTMKKTIMMPIMLTTQIAIPAGSQSLTEVGVIGKQ